MNYTDRDIGVLPSNPRHCTGFAIALPIQSLDPLECGRGEASCSIDIALCWSEKHLTEEHLLKACHRSKDECYVLNELYRQGYWRAT